jgi:hypothetical protein
LREEHDENDRGQAEDDSELYNRSKPADPGRIDANRDRIRHIQSVEWHDSGEDKADNHVQNRADQERAQNTDGHIAPRIFRLLRRGRDGIESDIRKKHHSGAAHHARPAVNSKTLVGRDEGPFGVARGDPVQCAESGRSAHDKKHNHHQLDRDNKIIEPRGLSYAHDQQRGDDDNDHCRRHVKDGSGK